MAKKAMIKALGKMAGKKAGMARENPAPMVKPADGKIKRGKK